MKNENRKKINTKKILKIIGTVLLNIYVAIRAVFVMYAVIFTIVASYGIYRGYIFFNEVILAPYKEVVALKENNPDESAYMTQVRERLRLAGESDTLVWRFVPLDSISRNLINAVIAVEDYGFYTHPGFSLDAIVEAIDHNRAANSIRRGASTITQQLAKNLFLTPERSFERKVKELGYAILMERYLGKDRILELYLNYAQWGKNIFGAQAAANTYFNKNAINLTLNESARMAATLAMPTKITPHHTRSRYMGQRLTIIANNLWMQRRIDAAGYTALTGALPPGVEPEPVDVDVDVDVDE